MSTRTLTLADATVFDVREGGYEIRVSLAFRGRTREEWAWYVRDARGGRVAENRYDALTPQAALDAALAALRALEAQS